MERQLGWWWSRWVHEVPWGPLWFRSNGFLHLPSSSSSLVSSFSFLLLHCVFYSPHSYLILPLFHFGYSNVNLSYTCIFTCASTVQVHISSSSFSSSLSLLLVLLFLLLIKYLISVCRSHSREHSTSTTYSTSLPHSLPLSLSLLLHDGR